MRRLFLGVVPVALVSEGLEAALSPLPLKKCDRLRVDPKVSELLSPHRPAGPAPFGYVYDGKAVVSGGLIEVYEYQKGVLVGGQQRERSGRADEADCEAKVENRHKGLYRAAREVKRLVEANLGQHKDEAGAKITGKFLTLTFAENVTDLDTANAQWTLFIKRLNYYLGRRAGCARPAAKAAKLAYLVVVEFQKRGAVHFHAVFFNLPYVPTADLASLWGQGFVKINRIEDAERPGAYVSKYMNKDRADVRLVEEKSYFTSRGLLRPIEIKDRAALEALWAHLVGVVPVYETTYETDYQGDVWYRQYRLRGERLEAAVRSAVNARVVGVPATEGVAGESRPRIEDDDSAE